MAFDETGLRPHRGRRPQTSAALSLLLLGALAAAALALALLTRLHAVLAGQSGPWRIEVAVEVGVTGIGALVALWLACSAAVGAACLVVRGAGARWRAGERWVHRYAPALVRKALVLAVGAGIGLGVATSASAVAPQPAPSVAVSVGTAPDDLGWVVTSPAPAPEPAPGPAAAPEPVAPSEAPPAPPSEVVPVLTQSRTVTPAAPAATGPGTVVVAAGDSLWAIAARHLPPGASDAQIAASWPRWYEANSGVVGADPGVIHAGQVLVVPAAADGVAR
jgi:LysM repeat protein